MTVSQKRPCICCTAGSCAEVRPDLTANAHGATGAMFVLSIIADGEPVAAMLAGLCQLHRARMNAGTLETDRLR